MKPLYIPKFQTLKSKSATNAMGTVAFSWEVNRHLCLLLEHNRDGFKERADSIKPACWDENGEVFGAKDEESQGYALSIAKDGRIAFCVHPEPYRQTPHGELLVSSFTTSKEPIHPQDFADMLENKLAIAGQQFYLIVADINARSMFYIKKQPGFALQYEKVKPGVYVLTDCGLDLSLPTHPTSPKSQYLKVKFENIMIEYGNDEPCGKTIAEEIMKDETKTDEHNELSSIFVATEGYGTLCTTSVSVKKFDPYLNCYEAKCFENYMLETGDWEEHEHVFNISSSHVQP